VDSAFGQPGPLVRPKKRSPLWETVSSAGEGEGVIKVLVDERGKAWREIYDPRKCSGSFVRGTHAWESRGGGKGTTPSLCRRCGRDDVLQAVIGNLSRFRKDQRGGGASWTKAILGGKKGGGSLTADGGAC